MKKLSDDLYGFTDNMHERALTLETRVAELETAMQRAIDTPSGIDCVAILIQTLNRK